MNPSKENQKKIDKPYLASVLLLAIGGFFVFSSASLGLLARNENIFQLVALKQSIGLILGFLAFYILSRIKYTNLRKYAFFILIASIIINLLIFIPSLRLSHGGASRWIDLGVITFQPSEFLKIAFIIYFAAWIASIKERIGEFKQSIIPYIIIVGILGLLLISQNDLDTLVVISGTGFAMLFAGGAKKRNMVLLFGLLIVALSLAIYIKPHAQARLKTFLNPDSDIQGAGYQINQSLIAIGSGHIAGRGYGQSIQKFNYLPEPVGDSIFAVQAEEFGFIGSLILLLLYMFFAFRSFKIATKSPDTFGGLVVIGIVILIIVESFMNIASMLGIIPLSGMPLLFVSHGGTALIITLGAAGIIASVSRHQKTT